MQSNFKAKHIQNAKKVLAQDLHMASRDLDRYKEIQKRRLEERAKKQSVWQRVMLFWKKLGNSKRV